MDRKTLFSTVVLILALGLILGSGCTKNLGPVKPSLLIPTSTPTSTYSPTPQWTPTPCTTVLAFSGANQFVGPGTMAVTVTGTYLAQFVTPQSVQLVDMDVLLAASNPAITFGVYSDLSNTPKNLLWASQPVASVISVAPASSEAIVNFSLNLPAGTYWIAVSSPNPMYLLAGSGFQSNQDITSGQMPNPFSGGGIVSLATPPVGFWVNAIVCPNYLNPIPTYTPAP